MAILDSARLWTGKKSENARPPYEPGSQSGAEDTRTPNAIATTGDIRMARSVWSADGFSAALSGAE